MQVVKQLWQILTPNERIGVVPLLFMTLVMALLDVVGVASIMPFVSVMANPELVKSNPILSFAYEASFKIGVSSVDQFLLLLGTIVFFLLVVSLLFKAATTYLLVRFSFMREFSIGHRLVHAYLHQPYHWYLSRNSSDVGKNVLSEVSTIVASGILPIMTVITQSVVATALVVTLLVIDYTVALTAISILGTAYLFLVKFVGGILSKLGGDRMLMNTARFRALNEAFRSPKEVKIGNLEAYYMERFEYPAERFARDSAAAQATQHMPRYLIELVVFGGMILIVLLLLSKSGSFQNSAPLIALYAFAGYRLMPSLQQIYSSISALRFVSPTLNALHNEISEINPEVADNQMVVQPSPQKSIELNNVTFRFSNGSKDIVSNLCLKISVGETVGIVGQTGSGKTTLIDLLVGLLDPTSGEILVDGTPLNKARRKSWMTKIAYVPQQVFLADDTVEANIALGVKREDINQARVIEASKLACIDKFISGSLTQGYKTNVGEDGINLSGGQRQRIAIARALYRNPEILILDEATSALDTNIEKEVIESVLNEKKNITVIMIAHRTSTLKECDAIYVLEDGKIQRSGTYVSLGYKLLSQT